MSDKKEQTAQYTYEHAKQIAEKFNSADPEGDARREVATSARKGFLSKRGGFDIGKLRPGVDYPADVDIKDFFDE